MTPHKYTDKRSTYNTVQRMKKKFGYDDDTDSKVLRRVNEEFSNKAVKY